MVNVLSLLAVAGTAVSGAAMAPQQEKSAVIAEATAQAPFDPYSYKKKFTTCKAVDRSGGKEKKIKLKLAYLDINPTAKKTLIMVHGWPSLWTTYRHQITDLGKEYRIILPENRGYGDSEHPKDLQDSNTMFDVRGVQYCGFSRY
jgi:soluble epoxide hydrolase/lipid-phosphate phosphatase